VEDEARCTGEGYRQPAYDYGSNVQRLDESCYGWRERGGVKCDRVGATRGHDVVLTRGEMRRTVVVRFARLIALVLQRQRGTVRLSGKLAHVPAEDENRRDDQQPPGHEPGTLGDLHDDAAYRAPPLVSRNGPAGSCLLES